MLVGSLIIVVGVEVVALGWQAGLGGLGKWLGGLLIIAAIAILALPIGIGLRFWLGSMGQQNLVAAVATGTAIGAALLPVLHPALRPPLSLETHPVALLIVHCLAGCAGGMAWFVIEQFQTPRYDGTG